MDLGLTGKSAIVTGGSLGIGASVALTLAREGCDVAINYRRHDTEAKEVVAEIENSTFGSCLSARQTEVLPAPDGPEITTSLPATSVDRFTAFIRDWPPVP